VATLIFAPDFSISAKGKDFFGHGHQKVPVKGTCFFWISLAENIKEQHPILLPPAAPDPFGAG
jgi:hypothetical protein